MVLAIQEQAGIDLLTDGELSRFDVNHPQTDCGFWMLSRSIADGRIRSLMAGRDLYEGRALPLAAKAK